MIYFTLLSFVQGQPKARHTSLNSAHTDPHTHFHPNIDSLLLFVQFQQKIWYISSLIAQSVKYLNTLLQLYNVSSKKYQDLSFGIFLFFFFACARDTKCTLRKTTHTQPGATLKNSLLVETKNKSTTRRGVFFSRQLYDRFSPETAGGMSEGATELEIESKPWATLKSTGVTTDKGKNINQET